MELAAICCHAAQLSSSPDMEAAMQTQQLFSGTECFLRAPFGHLKKDFKKGFMDER
jgi:hypothetical protein